MIYQRKRVRRQRIFILSLLSIGTIGIGASIAVPLVSNLNSNDSSNKNLENGPSLKSNQEKFEEWIAKGDVFLLEADNELNLAEASTQEKILSLIKQKIGTRLSSTEKSKIEILAESKRGTIKLGEIQTIGIKIKFDTKKEGNYNNLKVSIKNGSELLIDTIRAKITDRNLTIQKDVNTSNKSNILIAIKAQLQIDNPTLSNEDLLRISDINITNLIPESNNNVILTITVGSISDTINIVINRPLNDVESVAKAKEAINTLSNKEITISSTSGTITSNKVAILNGLRNLSDYSSLDLKDSTISIKDDDISLTTIGTPFTIVIRKGTENDEIVSTFTVKRSKTTIEINDERVAAIKAKIQNKNLTIGKNENTSNDVNILEAIKAQLQIDNPTLLDDDLNKISDNIEVLIPERSTNVILKITVGSRSDTINIVINRPLNDVESVAKAKEAINTLSNKEITINANSGTITDNKVAILSGLQNLSGYSELDLKGATITIKDNSDLLTTDGISFTIVITKGTENDEITSGFMVKRKSSDKETDTFRNLFNKLKSKIDKINLNQTLDDLNDFDIAASANQNKVKQFIFDKIDYANNGDELSQLEKNAISIVTSSGIVRADAYIDFAIRITFSSFVEDYIFSIRHSFDKTNLNSSLSSWINNLPIRYWKDTNNKKTGGSHLTIQYDKWKDSSSWKGYHAWVTYERKINARLWNVIKTSIFNSLETSLNISFSTLEKNAFTVKLSNLYNGIALHYKKNVLYNDCYITIQVLSSKYKIWLTGNG